MTTSTWTTVEADLRRMLEWMPESETETPLSLIEVHIESYTSFLRAQQKLQPQTIANRVSSALSAVKYVHRKDSQPSSGFSDVPAVQRLRQARRMFVASTSKSLPAQSVLQAEKRWLKWPEVLAVVKKLESEYRLKKTQAVLQKWLVLALYTQMPPVRAAPIRQLQVGHSLVKVDGVWNLDLRHYKTVKRYGRHTVALPAGVLGPLNLYLQRNYKSGDYVFLSARGSPFSAGAWTQYIQRIFHDATGNAISVNLLRESFVTHMMEREGGTTSEQRASVALAMGHSTRMQSRTYDRRDGSNRRAAGLLIAQEMAAGSEQECDSPSHAELGT